MSNNGNSSSGLGVLGLLGCIFVTLKLTGHITWSWWWVTAPLWGGFAIIAVVCLITLLVVGVCALFSGSKKRKTKW